MLLPVLQSPLSIDAAGPASIEAVRVLRLSLTDRCNYRCTYCMPADGVRWLQKDQLLTADQFVEIAEAALAVHGITRFKLTGGEPTLFADLLPLVRRLRGLPGVEDLSLTTNGQLLEHLARSLREAGLDRLTISIDSLRPERFRRITRTGDLQAVLRGLDAADAAGFASTKINVVAMAGVNDDELADFARLTIDRPITVRFIEYMPLGESQVLALDASEIGPAGGCGAQDRGGVFIPEQEIRRRIEDTFGELIAVRREREAGVGPAKVFRLPHARGRLGFISAMSHPFCDTCNRLRLTATGVLRSCLFDGGEVDLRPILDQPDRQQNIADAMVRCVRLKPQLHSGHGNQQMSRIGG